MKKLNKKISETKSQPEIKEIRTPIFIIDSNFIPGKLINAGIVAKEGSSTIGLYQGDSKDIKTPKSTMNFEDLANINSLIERKNCRACI